MISGTGDWRTCELADDDSDDGNQLRGLREGKANFSRKKRGRLTGAWIDGRMDGWMGRRVAWMDKGGRGLQCGVTKQRDWTMATRNRETVCYMLFTCSMRLNIEMLKTAWYNSFG